MNINELRFAIMRDFGFDSDEVTIISGIMGVPVSFLDKYCPEQFEIIDYMASHGKTPKGMPHEAPYMNGKWLYNRILIRKNSSI